MDTVVFSVHCSQERRIIGTVALRANTEPTAEEFVRGFRPDLPIYELRDASGALRIKDGQQALCPRCRGPLLITEPDKPGKGVYVVPTRMRIVSA